jgi:hypothetical protein
MFAVFSAASNTAFGASKVCGVSKPAQKKRLAV